MDKTKDQAEVSDDLRRNSASASYDADAWGMQCFHDIIHPIHSVRSSGHGHFNGHSYRDVWRRDPYDHVFSHRAVATFTLAEHF